MAEVSLFNPNGAASEQYAVGGVVKADCIKIRLVHETATGDIGTAINITGKDGIAGLVAQDYSAAIQRPIQRVWELGSTKYYVIDGKPSGQGAINNIWGPDKTVVQFWKNFGDICKPTSLIIESLGCQCENTSNAYNKRIRFQGGYMQTLQLSGQAANFVHAGSMQFIYCDAKISA